MAQKRMLDKKISDSEQVANLRPLGMVIFSWGIAHADDVGVLPGSHRVLKGLLIPLVDMNLEEFGEYVEEIVSEGLWVPFEYSGKTFYRLPNWFKTQNLKRDRQPSTILPIVVLPSPKDSWKLLEDIGFQMEKEGKGREWKVREEEPHAHRDWLTHIPPETLKELSIKYEASERQIQRKGEELSNYCLAKGKTYKNYRAFLENALDRDFGRRPPKKETPSLEKTPLTPEQREALEGISKSMRVKA